MKEGFIYLEFVISQYGLNMDPQTIKSIVEWSTPRSTFEVRKIHGLSSCYWKFIRNFSGVCATLTTCMRKGELQ
jgi:hypothetical protein